MTEVKAAQTEIVATMVAQVGETAVSDAYGARRGVVDRSGIPVQQRPLSAVSTSQSSSIPAATPMPLDAGECSKGLPLVLVKQWGQFNSPRDIAIDQEGNLIVVDHDANTATSYDPEGNRLTTIASRANGEGGLSRPVAVAVDSKGNVYVASEQPTPGDYVQKFSSEGEFILSWGTRVNSELDHPEGTFLKISGLAVDEDDNIYVLDSREVSRVQKFNGDGDFLTQWGSVGVDPGMFDDPNEIVADGMGNIYVADLENWRIQRFTTEGEYLGKWGTFGIEVGQFLNVGPIGVDGDGCVYTAQRDGGVATGGQKFSPDGAYLRSFGTEEGDARLKNPIAMTVGDDGTVYVVDAGVVKVFQPTP